MEKMKIKTCIYRETAPVNYILTGCNLCENNCPFKGLWCFTMARIYERLK